MDNASKALVMAGGVLIALMVVSVALYFLASVRGFAASVNLKNELSAVESFNRYYQSFGYSGSMITGLDALNIYNKAKNAEEEHEINISMGVPISTLEAQSAEKATDTSALTQKYKYTYSTDSAGYISSITIGG